MAWFKVDDQFWSHPKVIELSSDAIALWVRAGSWSSEHLTDGNIPRAVLFMLRADIDSAIELVNAGLWEIGGSGWRFHDWELYQPAREDVESVRAATRERQKKWREQHRKKNGKFEESVTKPVTTPVSNCVTNGVTNAVTTPVSNAVTNTAPTRPVPVQSLKEEKHNPRNASRTYSPAFEEFWKLYPTRRREKPKAYAEWLKAIKRASPEEIISGLRVFCTGDTTYAPYPARWLKQDSWDDGPSGSSPRRSSVQPDVLEELGRMDELAGNRSAIDPGQFPGAPFAIGR